MSRRVVTRFEAWIKVAVEPLLAKKKKYSRVAARLPSGVTVCVRIMYTVFLETYRNTTAQDFTVVRYHARQYGPGYKCTYEYSSLGRNNCMCV